MLIQVTSLKIYLILWLLYVATVWYNSKLFVFRPQIPCYDSGRFSALQFVTLAPEVLADIKTAIFDNDCCYSLILQLELSHNAI